MSDGGEGAVPATTLVGIALAAALVPLNSTMIAVALPHIAHDFDISKGRTSILVTLYLAGMLIGQPIAGRVCDAVGARRLAIVAVTGFGVFSAGAMVAGSFWVLVAMRALQSAFASVLVPSVQTMLRDTVPVLQRGRAFGVLGSVFGVGAGLGPVIGGLSTSALGWRAIFGINVPIVLAALYVLERSVPASAARPSPHATAAMPESVRLFNRVFGAAFSTQALSTVAQYGLLLAVPIVLDSRGWGAAAIGVAVSCSTAGLVATGPYGGRLGDRFGRRRPVVLGLSVALAAVTMSALGGDDVPSAVLVFTLLLFGVGLGVAVPSVMTAGMDAAPASRAGSAAGLLSASRYVGSIASTLVLAIVMHDDGSGFEALLIVCVVSLILCVVVARTLPGPLVGTPANAYPATTQPR